MNFIRLRTTVAYFVQRQKIKTNERKFCYDLDGIDSQGSIKLFTLAKSHKLIFLYVFKYLRHKSV
jgi:hypothetical protein